MLRKTCVIAISLKSLSLATTVKKAKKLNKNSFFSICNEFFAIEVWVMLSTVSVVLWSACWIVSTFTRLTIEMMLTWLFWDFIIWYYCIGIIVFCVITFKLFVKTRDWVYKFDKRIWWSRLLHCIIWYTVINSLY